MKPSFLIVLLLIFTNSFLRGQQKIYTADIDNFWLAHDSIIKVNDFSGKLSLIREFYIDRGTKGLRAFMVERRYNDTVWVRLIDKYPQFWNSIRPNTLQVKDKIGDLEKAIDHLKKIYPELREAEMYFTIGGLNSGGTVKDHMVLIGAEIATGNSTTDVSEFKDDWLKNVFREQSQDNIVSLNIHEYIHTQQRGEHPSVLNQCLKEGSCDFIAELAVQKSIHRKYLSYGRANSNSVKEQFKKEMFSTDLSNWLYNGSDKGESADLGYYIGYEICKAYYNQAKDKKQAVKDIIELDYNLDQAVENFLLESKFYTEPIHKKKLVKEYRKNQPFVVAIAPFTNGSQNVDPQVKELKIIFSKEMLPKYYSLNYSDKGRDFYPIKKVKGFENNNRTIVLEIDLKPDKVYEFVINDDGFKSEDGYALRNTKTSLIRFKTK